MKAVFRAVSSFVVAAHPIHSGKAPPAPVVPQTFVPPSERPDKAPTLADGLKKQAQMNADFKKGITLVDVETHMLSRIPAIKE